MSNKKNFKEIKEKYLPIYKDLPNIFTRRDVTLRMREDNPNVPRNNVACAVDYFQYKFKSTRLKEKVHNEGFGRNKIFQYRKGPFKYTQDVHTPSHSELEKTLNVEPSNLQEVPFKLMECNSLLITDGIVHLGEYQIKGTFSISNL